MPSPFPGMNPYLEQDDVWQDFHQRFATFAAGIIGAQVGAEYIVRIEEHLYIHELPDESGRLLGRADVGVSVRSGGDTGGGAGTLIAPAEVRLPAVDVERDAYIEIRGRAGRQLVTVVELLSPSNKRRGADREQYLSKRAQLLSSGTHLVEIDLLRGGPRLPPTDMPDCDYYALVSRAEERPRAGFWPIRLRDRLPEIPVPLRSPDADARLNLEDLLHRIYDDARYANYLYEGEPQPPLSPSDATWARQLAQSIG